ncbi:MAG: hypothetical protein ACR2JE_00255 [Acidobacteriaceae bacterium]
MTNPAKDSSHLDSPFRDWLSSRRTLLRAFALLSAGVLLEPALVLGQPASRQPANPAQWRTATEEELRSVIPARAPVQAERIETEFRTASGITDGNGHYVAGVVMITAGYSAEGKYSHFFLTQVTIRVGALHLPPGEYVFGWTRAQDTLKVSFYQASSGKLLGQVDATRSPSITRVESFRIWPPNDKSVIQIGRFTFDYAIEGK